MATTHDIARFGERLRAALPMAIAETFGGATDLPELVSGTPALQVADLGPGHHLHLEIDVRLGRQEARTLSLIMLATDGEKLFGLEELPDDELRKPDNQLRVLAEFTEGAEALAGAIAGALTVEGVVPMLRVSGASLEEAASSPAAAVAPLGSGETVGYAGVLIRPGGLLMPLVVALNAALAGAMAAAGPAAAAPPPTAAGRAADLAALQAARRPAPEPGAPPPMPAPARPPIAANPVSFGQFDPVAPAPRADRGVELILDVSLNVRVELGSTQMTVEEVLALSPGSVVELDRLAGEPVDIVINDRLIARGEVVVIEENFGVRVTEIVASRQRASALA